MDLGPSIVNLALNRMHLIIGRTDLAAALLILMLKSWY